jgi:serine/threonine-protein kinase HipA
MTSEQFQDQAYVWLWLPGASQPVVAGVLQRVGQELVFNYGQSYLQRDGAIPLYLPELPLKPGKQALLPGLSMPACIRDASPDAWGRRVLINRKFGAKGDSATAIELDELSYLLESGSDRIGALDFQHSPTHYQPRQGQVAPIEDLIDAADKIDRGLPIAADLDLALQHGTSLGGARPKVMIQDGGAQYIAKFSASHDLYNVVKAEYIAMRLAGKVGLNVAKVKLVRALGKDVLLIERFDRMNLGEATCRRAMVSALTMFGLDELMAAHASYEELAEIIRRRFSNPAASLRELFCRLVFNILVGNTDDHARNHAAFWDGQQLDLTPAFDICPQPRSGQQASQAMLIRGRDRSSQLQLCLLAANQFLIGAEEASRIIQYQVEIIKREWDTVCDEAGLSEVDRRFFWGRQFLNEFAFWGMPTKA